MGIPGTSIDAAVDRFAPDGSVVHDPPEPAAIPVELADLSDASGAVIIPAHDEAEVIARTLGWLAPLADAPDIEVIVACNGCRDDTAAIARGFAGVLVVETDRASKPAALNLGDHTATRWPRLYLDADIDIAPATVLAVFAALAAPGILAARPRHVYDTTGASQAVRAYFRARSRIPAPPARLWGAGGYATNAAGHARFEAFPAITADDSWFDAQFADHEKTIVATAPMRVRTPRDTRDLLAVLTRQRRGYLELGIASEAQSRGRGLLSSVRGPRTAADAACYAAISVISRVRAAARAGTGAAGAWERDASSRTAAKS